MLREHQHMRNAYSQHAEPKAKSENEIDKGYDFYWTTLYKKYGGLVMILKVVSHKF